MYIAMIESNTFRSHFYIRNNLVHKIKLHPQEGGKKTGIDKEARDGRYLSKVKLRVVGYVEDSMLRGRDVQTFAACTRIDSRIMQLGYLGAACRCRIAAAL